jgi:SAM-dependent methyltransferase
MFHVKPSPAPRICDYEGSDYRERFWEQADRGYEDAAERLAIRRLLPANGRRLAEIGAGFGRLVDEYRHFDEVFLVDYAHSMIRDARMRLAESRPGLRFVCADLYQLPFSSSALDTIIQIRVLHHVERLDAAFCEVARCLGSGGSYVLEFANKRNLKAILRHWSGQQAEDPFSPDPFEFVPLNWNHHPSRVNAALDQAGLAPITQRSVSLFRLGALKQRVPAERLASADDLLAGVLAPLSLSPSHFIRALKTLGAGAQAGLWRCPACGAEPLPENPDAVPCFACGRRWPIVDGVFVFRSEVADSLRPGWSQGA